MKKKLFEYTKDLFFDVMSLNYYKRVNLIIAIFLTILALPLYILFILLFILTFFSAILVDLFKILTNWMVNLKNQNTKEIKHATEAVSYFFFIPFILVSNVLLFVEYIQFIILNLIYTTVGYAISFGQINFEIFPKEEYIYSENKHMQMLFPIIFIVLMLAFIVLFLWVGSDYFYSLIEFFIDGYFPLHVFLSVLLASFTNKFVLKCPFKKRNKNLIEDDLENLESDSNANNRNIDEIL